MSGGGIDIFYGADGTAWNAALAGLIARHGLRDFDRTMHRQDGHIIKHAVPQRKTVHLTEAGIYLKRQYAVGFFTALKNLLRLSPEPTAFDEFENILALHRTGIPTVTPVAAGRRKTGLLQTESFLVTQALQGCSRLDHYLVMPHGPAEKRELICQVAQLVKNMHAAGFNHRDLYLCHILRCETGDLHIVDLHRVQRRGKVPQRWVVKDMAALNYSAPPSLVSRVERLRFLKAYLGTQRLSKQDKAFALKVLKKTEKMIEHNKKSMESC